MTQYTFHNEGGQWYIDLPEWRGPKGDLAMVAGADKLLDRLSEGRPAITLTLDTEPFDGCDVLTKVVNTPFIGGATYRHNNKLLWLCKVTSFVFGYMPKKIYFKPLAEA